MSTIVTRSSKGSFLTWAGMDANLTNLNDDKVEEVNPITSGTLTHSGNITLSGIGRRITGDFSNSTIANRVMFQTSTVNTDSVVGVLPNGTSSFSYLECYGSSNPTNASRLVVGVAGTEAQIRSDITGTGAIS